MSLASILHQVKHAVASPFESKSQAQPQAAAVQASAASSTTGSSSASANQATITGNDFLTLLVTEIQNQDPTQQTDPMQYITQLVGVNSLEQLVQINQTLSANGGSTSSPNAQASTAAVNVAAPSSAARSNAVAAQSTPAAAIAQSAQKTASNLLPSGSSVQIPPAAESAVAHALTHSSALAAAPPTQVPLSPEVMRALQQSIPGATLTGQSVPATGGTGGPVR